MKLKQEEVDFMDLTHQSDEEFWQSLRDLMRFGVPAYDGKGHFADLRVKVRPLQIDMISAIREKMPDGWFKNQAALIRVLIAIGCKVAFKMLNQKDSEWADILDGLNKIAKQHRLDEFKRDMEALKDSVIKDSIEPQEKLRLIKTIDTLEKSFVRQA